MMPRIKQVQACDDYVLHVTFQNGVSKLYDVKPRFNDERFKHLRNKQLFQSVQVDTGGFGVSWNDDIDLSEYELWIAGTEAK